MDDLISRTAAIANINKAIPEWSEDKEIAIDCLKNTPTADVVEVIRCKDCKHGDWYKNAKEEWRCYCLKTEACDMEEDDFCSYAERRTDE